MRRGAGRLVAASSEVLRLAHDFGELSSGGVVSVHGGSAQGAPLIGGQCNETVEKTRIPAATASGNTASFRSHVPVRPNRSVNKSHACVAPAKASDGAAWSAWSRTSRTRSQMGMSSVRKPFAEASSRARRGSMRGEGSLNRGARTRCRACRGRRRSGGSRLARPGQRTTASTRRRMRPGAVMGGGEEVDRVRANLSLHRHVLGRRSPVRQYSRFKSAIAVPSLSCAATQPPPQDRKVSVDAVRGPPLGAYDAFGAAPVWGASLGVSTARSWTTALGHFSWRK